MGKDRAELLYWYQKENYIIEIMDDLGLYNASERTKTLVTCILFMASISEETIAVNKVEFFEKRTALVAKITSHFKLRVAHHGQVANYPETASREIKSNQRNQVNPSGIKLIKMESRGIKLI